MKLEHIEGIGPVFSKKLARVGIKSMKSLLTIASSTKGRKGIINATGIPETLIMDWVNTADLLRIKGVGLEYSKLLRDAGVDTVLELRQWQPVHLYERLIEVNENRRLVAQAPSRVQVANWINQAKSAPRLLSYGDVSTNVPFSRLAGDSTTDAPRPGEGKRKKKKNSETTSEK